MALSKRAASPVAAMYSAFSASSCRALLMHEATCDASLALPPALLSSSCIRLHTAHRHVARTVPCSPPVYRPLLLLTLQKQPDLGPVKSATARICEGPLLQNRVS